MKRFLASLLLLVLLLPARADDKKKDDKPESSKSGPVTVPFELLKSGHMAVMIKINGKGPYRVIFDTGAPMSLVSSKLAKDAGLERDPKAGGFFNPFGMGGESKAKTLELGDAKLANTTVIIMDHPTVQALADYLKKPLEGIVGFPVFARFKTTINYQDKTLTLVPNGYKPGDVMDSMSNTLMAILEDKKPAREVLSPSAQWGMVITKKSGDEDAGVTIEEVFPGGAADAAGLKKGDRLLTLDGRWTDSVLDTYVAAGLIKPREAVKIKIKRDSKEKELTVKPVSGF